MTSFKKQCIALRKQNKTLPEIMKITGRPKTSVFYHIQNIPLSEKKQAKIAQENLQMVLGWNEDKKGKSALNRHPIPFSTWTPELVLLISHLMFDGRIHHGGCDYYSSHPHLVERVQNLMKLIYKFPPKKRVDARTGVVSIGYYNVELSAFLNQKAEMLRKDILNLTKQHKRMFLRAFFDDEGCISFNLTKGRRRVRGFQDDQEVLQLVQSLLSDFDIESRIQTNNCDEIIVSRKKNLMKFRDEINFSPEVRVNGNRSNSIWGESLEKREILNRAIDSYQT